jgi:hypothetical protein
VGMLGCVVGELVGVVTWTRAVLAYRYVLVPCFLLFLSSRFLFPSSPRAFLVYVCSLACWLVAALTRWVVVRWVLRLALGRSSVERWVVGAASWGLIRAYPLCMGAR